MQYNNLAATAIITAAPPTMNLTSLSTDSTNLQTRSNYTLCALTDQSIPMEAMVFIDFPP
jgi:hypothetical protein